MGAEAAADADAGIAAARTARNCGCEPAALVAIEAAAADDEAAAAATCMALDRKEREIDKREASEGVC